jgi:hypothetical protein
MIHNGKWHDLDESRSKPDEPERADFVHIQYRYFEAEKVPICPILQYLYVEGIRYSFGADLSANFYSAGFAIA